tara:strand:- start:423 stop:542 length:120 start_codon:yes stop_codon:yes gene_type:complete
LTRVAVKEVVAVEGAVIFKAVAKSPLAAQPKESQVSCAA